MTERLRRVCVVGGAGFMPHAIKCFRHKFGLNTFAVATVTEQHR